MWIGALSLLIKPSLVLLLVQGGVGGGGDAMRTRYITPYA